MMQNTCDTKCPLWKKYKEHCPNYIENIFKPSDSDQPQLIKDCALRRAMMMLGDLSNRLLALQREVNIYREAQYQTQQLLMDVLKHANAGTVQFLSLQDKPVLVESKDE